MLRLIKRSPTFSSSSYKNTFAQVWVLFWDLGFAFWEDQTLFEMEKGVGTPLKIDMRTKNHLFCLYARLLIDVNFWLPVLKKLSVTSENGEKVPIGVEYESVPTICEGCGVIGHQEPSCKVIVTEKNPTMEVQDVYVHGRSTDRSSKRQKNWSRHHSHRRKNSLAL